jgi:hypothetical protein
VPVVLFHHGLNELAGLSNVYLAIHTHTHNECCVHLGSSVPDCISHYGRSWRYSWYSSLLQAGLTKNQIPVEGRFSVPVQTVPDTHPAYYTLGTRSFLGVKQPERGADHASPSRANVASGLELYLCLPSVPA